MIFTITSTDSSMVLMIDITCFNLGIGSPSMAFPITSSPFLIEAIVSEDVEVWELPATPGTGEHQQKGSLSRFISRPNEKSDDPIQDTSNHSMKLISQCGHDCLQTELGF